MGRRAIAFLRREGDRFWGMERRSGFEEKKERSRLGKNESVIGFCGGGKAIIFCEGVLNFQDIRLG